MSIKACDWLEVTKANVSMTILKHGLLKNNAVYIL